MRRWVERAHGDTGQARRQRAGARHRARFRSVSLYALLVGVGVVAAFVSLVALLAFLGGGD